MTKRNEMLETQCKHYSTRYARHFHNKLQSNRYTPDFSLVGHAHNSLRRGQHVVHSGAGDQDVRSELDGTFIRKLCC